ncbi:diguanylate cyclase/phosphodiesterase with GAF sensor [Deinococcus aerius]|uniref:Diguanylate cyclase/phosphodiesterase with GAF sensor n=1 Tax=Deinococcus aerius TaxID=200253 RepID=A0A2I9CXH5_9DEIO|nr:EAL domain-containing protein [Deinococcus aerius]GBF06782.1 diguanylate cyclase/phosphodiesterase with GAF sensor [Deinococcus aerius]
MERTVDPHEAQRLECLHRYQVLDTPPEAEFDRITRFVKHLLEAPIVIICFVAVRRTWLKSSVGTNIHEMDRESVCCGEAIRRDEPFVVGDLHADPRFQNDPMVKFEGARSYAGAPLITPDGYRIGTLAVYDHHPREFTPEQRTFLQDLAAIVIDTLELRLTVLNWKQAQERSEHLAHHDALTGLPNRLMLLDRAEQALRQADRRGTPVGMLVLDLDGFKVINDSLGHAVGDALLRAVGERLSHVLRAEDTVARFGGDEFVVLLPELRGTLDAANVALKLQETLREPFQVRSHTLVTNCSVGISLYPADGRDAEALLRAADTAMYQAKAVGKGQCCFYEEEMTRAAQEKLHLRGRLAQALEREEFRLHYQPQVDLGTGRVIGLEALLRWPQPDGSWTPPGQFIPLAESSGLIVPLGAWVLREACAQLGRWRERGSLGVDLSVNVSARQWEDPSFPEQVRRVLGEAGLPPERLVLEVTESVLFSNPQGARRLAQGLASLGVRVAVDDYGTGFSNLRQLQHLPIGQLKLDRSFVQPLPGGDKDQALVRSAVTLARGLNAAVVGEGIETEGQLTALRRLGCTVGQGFLLGRPVGAEEFEARHLRP